MGRPLSNHAVHVSFRCDGRVMRYGLYRVCMTGVEPYVNDTRGLGVSVFC